jgi:hypothetical protein
MNESVRSLLQFQVYSYIKLPEKEGEIETVRATSCRTSLVEKPVILLDGKYSGKCRI